MCLAAGSGAAAREVLGQSHRSPEEPASGGTKLHGHDRCRKPRSALSRAGRQRTKLRCGGGFPAACSQGSPRRRQLSSALSRAEERREEESDPIRNSQRESWVRVLSTARAEDGGAVARDVPFDLTRSALRRADGTGTRDYPLAWHGEAPYSGTQSKRYPAQTLPTRGDARRAKNTKPPNSGEWGHSVRTGRRRNDPKGIRTPVTRMRTWCPRPG
jgi:hypothetical protein